ncbi:MAG TPA: hypothetical protein VFE06_04545 [Acidobacteriaceae bacterium]|nr:hypothetical protein [Acidobacteriaceae bacterium]
MNSSETSVAAQQDQAPPPKQDESKPAKKDEAKPAKPTRETKDAKPRQGDQQPMHPAQPDKADKQQPKTDRQQAKPATRNERQSSANPAPPQSAHQGHGQPAGRNARIPDNDFKAHFGRPHAFAVRQVVTTTRVVPNQTQFAYGGYTFIFLDPWPDDWAPSDDCYIDYMDGEYFLIDVAHPGVRIALSIIGG